MGEKNGAQAVSLLELVLVVCLVALFGAAAVQGLGEARGPAQVQTEGSGQAGAKQQTIAEKIAASQQLLDINAASAEQLQALPGMGAEYAKRVIEGRPYSAKNQLATRGILPKDEYERIREMIVAHRVKQQ